MDKEGHTPLEVNIFAFVGPLIRRQVMGQIGFPRGDFFISADATEYAIRIKNAGFRTICVPGAVFRHGCGGKTVRVRRLGRVSTRSTRPAWKNDYSVRNGILMARSIDVPTREKTGVYLYIFKRFGRAALAEFVYEQNFLEKWKDTAVGVWEDLLNKMGNRVVPVVKQMLPARRRAGERRRCGTEAGSGFTFV